MPLKYYHHLMSQPCRALYMFLKANNIPFESCFVDLQNLEHRGEKFTALNPFQAVPVIDDDGFVLTESSAILKYLALKYRTPEHWYPANDLQKQARIDEYLHWQHSKLRENGVLFFQTRVWRPLFFKEPIDEVKLAQYRKTLLELTEKFEQYFIGKTAFISSDEITIADIQALAEFMQPYGGGFDIFAEHPHLAAWRDRVKQALNPYFDEAHAMLYQMAESVAQQAAPK